MWQLLSTGSDGLLKLWTIKTSECVDSFDHHTDKVPALSCPPPCPGTVFFHDKGNFTLSVYSKASIEVAIPSLLLLLLP